MASNILLYKKTVGDLTWAILGDPSYSMDWFNTAGDTPAKATLRIYSKDDSKLTAIMNNLNNKVVFQFDDQDFYDCIFFNILWYGYSMMGDIYEEFETTKLGKGSDGESGPWFPSRFSFIPDDAVFGDDDPSIYEDYTYFKVYDYEATRGSGVADGFDLSVKMVLALSSTGEGNPEKMVYYQGDIKLSDLADCVYKKTTHYYDLGGSSGEETIDHKYAVEWSTAEVGDLVTPYDSTNYELNAVCEVDEIGVDPEDSDLHYISYKGKEVTSATNIAHFNAIVAGTESAITSDKKVLNATSGNVSDSQSFISDAGWTKFGDNDNVYTATGTSNGSSFNFLMIYNPKYDIYQVWGANASYNNDCKGDFTSYPSKMSGGGATIVDTSDPNCDVYTCTYGGKMYVDIVPKYDLIAALQDANKGVDFYTYKAEGSYNMVKDPAKQRDIAAMISPVTNEPPIPAGMYCYSIIDDYNAYLSDYEHVEVEELVPTMEYEYCEYYEGISTSSTSLKIYDGTTELDDATALTGTVTSVSTVEGTSMTKIEFTDSTSQSYKIYFVKCGTNKDGYIKKSLVVTVAPAMPNGLHETDFRGIAFNNMYLDSPSITIQSVTSTTPRNFVITTKAALQLLAFNNSWTPAELGDVLYPISALDPEMSPDLYFKRRTAGEEIIMGDYLSGADGAKRGRGVVFYDQASGLVASLNYTPSSANLARCRVEAFIQSYKDDITTMAGYNVYASKDDIETAKTAAAKESFKANSVKTCDPTGSDTIGTRYECIECAVGRGNMFNIWKVTGLVYAGVTPTWASDDSFYVIELCPLYTPLPPAPCGGAAQSTDDYLSWCNTLRKGATRPYTVGSNAFEKSSFFEVIQMLGTNTVFNFSGSIRSVHTLEEAEAIVNLPYYHAT